jgi:hypothetical protein
VAEIRKTGAGNQPHIARADHGNPHSMSDFLLVDLTHFAKCIEINRCKLPLSLNCLLS